MYAPPADKSILPMSFLSAAWRVMGSNGMLKLMTVFRLFGPQTVIFLQTVGPIRHPLQLPQMGI
jgi:hypothetical protein